MTRCVRRPAPSWPRASSRARGSSSWPSTGPSGSSRTSPRSRWARGRPASTRTARPSSAATSPSTRRRRWRWSRTATSLERLQGAGGRPAGLKAIVLMDGEAAEPGVAHLDGLPRPGPRLARRRGGPAHRRREAGRRGDADLHLGHHRHAEGRDAHPAQPRLHRGEGAGDPARAAPGTGSSATCRSPTSRSRSSRTCSRSRPAPASTSRRASRSCRRTCARCGRTSSSACRACGRRSRPACRRRAPRRARSGAASRPGRGASASPAGYADQEGRPRPWSYGLADRLVFSKVRAAAGLRRGPHARRLRRAHREGDARLLPEPRPADHGGLRHERVHGADHDVAPEALPPGPRRATRSPAPSSRSPRTARS